MLISITISILLLINFIFHMHGLFARTMIIDLPMEPVYLKAGDKMKLICEQNDNFKTAWLRHLTKKREDNDDDNVKKTDVNKYENIQEGFILKSYSKDGRYMNILIKPNVTEEDAGSYKCEVLNNLERSYAVDVNIFTIIAVDGVTQGLGNQSSVSCLLHSDVRNFPEVEWRRSNKVIDVIESHKKYIINTSLHVETKNFNTTLTIKRSNDQDSGLYICSMRFGPIWFNHTVQLFSAPHVRIMDRSVTTSEGSKVEVTCVVFGWPSPSITWLRSDNTSIPRNKNQRIHYFTPHEDLDNEYEENDDDDLYGKDERLRHDSTHDNDDWSHRNDDNEMQLINHESHYHSDKEAANAKSKYSAGKFQMGNSTLVVVSAEMSDRDIYICEANAYINDSVTLKSRAMILLRIKGRYAFIYPLIGIIIEFIILLVIIIVYEKKRNKESENEQTAHIQDDSNIFQPLVKSSTEKNARLRK